jgi:hypothetical protein
VRRDAEGLERRSVSWRWVLSHSTGDHGREDQEPLRALADPGWLATGQCSCVLQNVVHSLYLLALAARI